MVLFYIVFLCYCYFVVGWYPTAREESITKPLLKSYLYFSCFYVIRVFMLFYCVLILGYIEKDYIKNLTQNFRFMSD